MVETTSNSKNNANSNEKLNITINQAIDNPYLAMQVKDQVSFLVYLFINREL